ncbi:MAG: DegT/DnrJ/EryC1/StrS family aminotransferase [Candidatus Woesearchaeota archaeon]|nr:DegT/DnrJ/EryC1/StrS family aminotransferase [Candidatus Woesearchaeota archaeon]
MNVRVPLSKPFIDKEDIKAVVEVLKSGFLSLGPKLPEFEKAVSDYAGVKHAIAVNSGTSALHLCIRALGIKDGDEVITSPYSFIASSNCILFERAKPVFVDIDEKTFNIDPDKIEAAITEKTKAILVVHVFGLPAEMDRIIPIAKKHSLKIIEDSAEALGAKYKGRFAGTFGDCGVYAFYPNKQMTTGEGGIIVTNDDCIDELSRSMRSQGRDSNNDWLRHIRLGYNYRLDEMSCALGISQLKKIDFLLSKRESVAANYGRILSKFKEVILPYENDSLHRSWFVYVIRLAENVDRDKVIENLVEKGIQSKQYFPPIHLQEFYKRELGCKEGMFPNCEKVAKGTLALPFFTSMKKSQVKEVCLALKDAIKESKVQ